MIYVLRLAGAQINGDEVVCTGEQLRLILEHIAPDVTNHVWYMADVDAMRATAAGSPPTPIPAKVGHLPSLISFSASIGQFLSGVFVGLPVSSDNLNPSLTFYSDDEPGHHYLPGAIVIRAFDTTYYEIATDSDVIAELLTTRFGGELTKVAPASKS